MMSLAFPASLPIKLLEFLWRKISRDLQKLQDEMPDDERTHAFAYSIYSHRGVSREGKVELQAFGFNSQLLAIGNLQRQSAGTMS